MKPPVLSGTLVAIAFGIFWCDEEWYRIDRELSRARVFTSEGKTEVIFIVPDDRPSKASCYP